MQLHLRTSSCCILTNHRRQKPEAPSHWCYRTRTVEVNQFCDGPPTRPKHPMVFHGFSRKAQTRRRRSQCWLDDKCMERQKSKCYLLAIFARSSQHITIITKLSFTVPTKCQHNRPELVQASRLPPQVLKMKWTIVLAPLCRRNHPPCNQTAAPLPPQEICCFKISVPQRLSID